MYRSTVMGLCGSFLLTGVFLVGDARATNIQRHHFLVTSQLSCLPADVKLSDPVVDPTAPNKRATVESKLRSLRARCRKARLLDRHGREIRFYHLVGCWGNPPRGYDEILKRQEREIADMRKRYTLLEVPCDQGQPIQ
jgi:hypothetical protein